MGKEQELDHEALVEARVASRTALMSGQATSASVADIAVRAYLAARRSSSDEAEVVTQDMAEAGQAAHAKRFPEEPISDISAAEIYRAMRRASPSGVKAGVTDEVAARVLKARPFGDATIGKYLGLEETSFHSIAIMKRVLVRAFGVGDQGMGEAPELDEVRSLVAWLLKRAKPDAGLDYRGGVTDLNHLHKSRPSRVELQGSDADFVAEHFHGHGAQHLADAIYSLLPTPPIQGDAK